MVNYALQSVFYRQHMLIREIKPVNEAEGKSGGIGRRMSGEMMEKNNYLESCGIHAVILHSKQLCFYFLTCIKILIILKQLYFLPIQLSASLINYCWSFSKDLYTLT